MRRRPQSTLEPAGFPVVVVSGLSTLLLLGVCGLLGKHRVPQYGIDVLPAETHFTMRSIERDNTHTITISAGDKPRLFFDAKELQGSWQELETQLKALEGNPNVHIVLVQDEAVSVGTTQRIVDRILTYGYSCSLAARPALD